MQTAQLRLDLAVKKLKALRALPATEGIDRAQRKILDRLNLNELAEVAMRLHDLEERSTTGNAPLEEVSRG